MKDKMILNAKEIINREIGCQICGEPADISLKTLSIEEGVESIIVWVAFCKFHYEEVLKVSC